VGRARGTFDPNQVLPGRGTCGRVIFDYCRYQDIQIGGLSFRSNGTSLIQDIKGPDVSVCSGHVFDVDKGGYQSQVYVNINGLERNR